MKLTSDFHDYYDHCFDGIGDEFVRIAVDAGPDKPEQFNIMKAAGFKTPPYGTLDELYDIGYWDEGRISMVVAYTDVNKHVGEGKELWSIDKWKTNPDMSGVKRNADKWDTFCSAYVDGPYGISWRMLQVGKHVFWIEYNSDTDWRSNCGEGDINLLEYQMDKGYHPYIKLPLFAIDFIHGKKDMYAIDFNISPGVRGTGVEKVLTADKFVDAIELAFQDFSNQG